MNTRCVIKGLKSVVKDEAPYLAWGMRIMEGPLISPVGFAIGKSPAEVALILEVISEFQGKNFSVRHPGVSH